LNLATFSRLPATGWSAVPDAALDSEQTLVLAFGPSSLLDAPGPLAQVLETYPRAHVLGCSTSGEIHGAQVHDDSLAIAVLRFAHTRLRVAGVAVSSGTDSARAGEALANSLCADDLRAVLVFSDGLSVNGSALVRGLNAVLPPSVVVSGGLAGDGDRFRRTWVIRDRRIATGCVCAVGLYGDRVRVGHGSKGGWDAFGVERRVTRSAGNVLYELDDQPALSLYKTYLGERAAGLPATALLFPLALRPDTAVEQRVVRTVLAVDERARSMTFAGDVPEGWLAQLMYANFDRLVQGAGEAALSARGGGADHGETFALAVSCVGRRLVLGERAEEEIEAALEVLPPCARQIGFYSYGEISPHASGRCDLHNQTMTLTTLAEA